MTLEMCDESKMMRKNKTYLVLYMYNALEKGRRVEKASFCLEAHISPRAFDRYISEIRCFLAEEENDLELVYDYLSGGYRLVKVTL